MASSVDFVIASTRRDRAHGLDGLTGKSAGSWHSGFLMHKKAVSGTSSFLKLNCSCLQVPITS